MYVVRSMSTTDYDYRSGAPVVPYHVYLLPSHRRARAYWTASAGEAAKFETPQEAEAEIARAGLMEWDLRTPSKSHQVAPLDDRTVPAYWEVQAMHASRAREQAADLPPVPA